MADATHTKQTRRATPFLDTLVKVICFAVAACWMAIAATSDTERYCNGIRYSVQKTGVPFEYYACESPVIYHPPEDDWTIEAYNPFAFMANIVFWAGCLGMSICVVQRKPDIRFTMRELFLCITLFCISIALCSSSALLSGAIFFAIVVTATCSVLCVTVVWLMQRLADISVEFRERIRG